MAYVYTIFIVTVIGVICYRMIKQKKIPSNHYTPFDNITMGKKIDVKRTQLMSDTKHEIKYEEKTNK